MLTTRCRPTAPAFLSPLLISICLVGALLFHLPESTARNEVTAPDRKDGDAQQALALGEQLQAKWTEASLGEAANQFEQAASIWTSTGDFSNASRAILKSGDVYFYRSEYGEAEKRYQDAVALAAKTGDATVEARALSRLARVSIYLGKNDQAQEHLAKALALSQSGATPEEKNARGEALTVEGELLQVKGNLQQALSRFDEALKSLDDKNGQARVHLFRGYIQGSIGNTDKAIVEIEQALELYRAINNRVGEAQALSALGLSHAARNEHDESIQLYVSAREIMRSVGDRHSEAITCNSLAEAYEQLKQFKSALDHYEEALRLFESIDAVNGIAPTTCLVAHAHVLNNHLDQALTLYRRCLDLSRKSGMARTEAGALNEIAGIYASQHRYKLAFRQQQKAQRFYEKIPDQRGLARALNVDGDIWIQAGQMQRAFNAYEQALLSSEKSGEQDTQLRALYGLTKTKLALGSPEVALSFIQRSLKLIEEQRSNLASPDFRTTYFSGERPHYDLCTEILMQLERLHPGQGSGAQALSISEQSRARLLREFVTESRASIREGAAKDLLYKEGEIRGLIRAQGEYRLHLSAKDSAELAEVDAQLDQLKGEYQRVEAQLRQQSPYLFSLEKFEPLTFEQIQKALEPDTILLEYSLGDERSYLWMVTSDSLQLYELPKRQLIEEAVRNYYQLLTAWQEGQGSEDYQAKITAAEKALPETGGALSQMLLGPVADKLSNKRLIIVPEGALQFVPFGALPSLVAPESATPLLDTHEIIVEPSFSALVAIRKSTPQHSTTPGKLVAVIADPVLSLSDDRVQHDLLSPGTALASTDQKTTPGPRLTRLAHASEEADAIYAVAPWGSTLVAKGFDANRETAMSADVGQYQIVHFATHGFLDSERPELSGIVLTMVDRNGANTDGLMSLHDIYSLDLSAQLTVLSACQTALGKDIQGEGMVGLNHAFLSAGSKSVVSTLWKVDDRATAVFMSEFYESMLQQGMSPAAALRSAQLKMRHSRWSAPYYWAGFVIQGEYTNRIAIDHRSSFRVALVVLILLSLVTAGVVFLQKRKRRRILRTQSTGTERNL